MLDASCASHAEARVAPPPLSTGSRYGVEIRAALPADAADVASLLRDLGQDVTPHEAAERLDAVRRAPGSSVLVAVDYGPAVGLIAVHWNAVLQHARPMARVSALVVAEPERRRGIGRLLVKAGAQAARVAGCERLEIAAGPGEQNTQAFWLALGFNEASPGFSRALRKNRPRED
jgi:aminoglycoside 6'-N-acetyltransferase I